ncbi:MAG: hypothetical protein KDD94_15030 [Calditrichaeota bacterium]|nr:hypothetical protein [Calditrichota bacterium]
MTNTLKSVVILIILFIGQFFLHSFQFLLVIAFALGSLLYFERFHFLIYTMLQLITVSLLIMINGLNGIVLQQFGQLTMKMGEVWLLLLVLVISTLTVSLPATSSALLSREIRKKIKS